MYLPERSAASTAPHNITDGVSSSAFQHCAIGDESILCRLPFTGIFLVPGDFGDRILMSKRASDGSGQKDRSMTEEAAPPLLSEKLVAQLQGAVRAAQRRRKSDPNDPSANGAVNHISLPDP